MIFGQNGICFGDTYLVSASMQDVDPLYIDLSVLGVFTMECTVILHLLTGRAKNGKQLSAILFSCRSNVPRSPLFERL